MARGAKAYPVSFEQFHLDPRIVRGIKSTGFTEPTPIQKQALPVVLKGRDILGTLQTGTGKTAALPCPSSTVSYRASHATCAPDPLSTRELAEQIHDMISELAQHTRIRSLTIYGGVSKGPQVDGLRRGAEIVVACPGRLLDLMGEGVVDLSHVEILVLDEADRMCDMGFLPDVRKVLKPFLPSARRSSSQQRCLTISVNWPTPS